MTSIVSKYTTRYAQSFSRFSSTSQANSMAFGVFLAVLSNVLFGVLYAYGKWMAPLSGTTVFLWRIVMIWACLALFLVLSGKIAEFRADLQAIKGIKAWLWMILPTPILMSQLWLFMWAPVNGQSVEVSMGYFLFPLAMVVAGFLVFREHLSRLQSVAVGLAAAGVAMELVRTGSFSWATLWVCGTYPIYYVMRRKQGIRATTGLFFDVSLAMPVCVAAIVMSDAASVASDGVLLAKAVGLGAISVLALLTNLQAGRLLPVSLFGMLSYIEPVLLFLLSITILGGVFSTGMLASYGLIWLAVICLMAQGWLANRRKYDGV